MDRRTPGDQLAGRELTGSSTAESSGWGGRVALPRGGALGGKPPEMEDDQVRDLLRNTTHVSPWGPEGQHPRVSRVISVISRR